MKSVCTVSRNYCAARFTGNFFPWICETPDGKTYCETRESARDVARDYNNERRELLREGLRIQGGIELELKTGV